jgi:predicted dehydrogenase
MSSVRVAVIGYGLAGSVFHAPLVSVTPTMTLAAIVTASAERQAQARRAYPHAQILKSVDELWSNATSYDLVVVAAPNRAHVTLGIAALQAGLPVVIDKPLAASVADAERLLAVSKQTGLMLSVFQNRRWDNDFLTVQKIVSAGLLGKVTRFESRYERYRLAPRPHAWREMAASEEAGGLLYDLGSHLIDQAYVLFGKPTHVYAEMDLRRPQAVVDDDTFVALHFEHGVRAHFWMSLVSRLPAQRVRVNGLLGTYEKWGLDPQEDALRMGMRPGDAGWGQEPREHWGRLSIESGGSSDSSRVHIDGQVETVPGAYQNYYALLAEALLHGGQAPVDPLGVIDVLRVIEAAQKSAREGSVVELS